ncbi:MAG TPA: thiol:disulfide interchange protein DsbA/DsbL [Rhodocyclaceae bacterium]|nr:thiol:disulfide interchange protein DsbA/DsbL [Rhodocyclaceae bacterium]
MNRRLMLKGLAVLAALSATAPTVLAQQGGGELYNILPNRVASETSGKVEVIEFFHYGCPHCRDFHPLMKEWLKRLPEDVEFRAVPAIWGNAQLRGLARLYYAAERSGHLASLEDAIFAAVQDERLPIHTEEGVRDWIGRFDLDAKAFMDTYNSFAMQAMVQRADQVARAYRVQGVPTMAVGGRYVTSASITGSHENTLKVVDELIVKARAELE